MRLIFGLAWKVVWDGMGVKNRPAPLYFSYATGLGGDRRVLACRLLRGSTGLLLFRVNVLSAVGGPWTSWAWALGGPVGGWAVSVFAPGFAARAPGTTGVWRDGRRSRSRFPSLERLMVVGCVNEREDAEDDRCTSNASSGRPMPRIASMTATSPAAKSSGLADRGFRDPRSVATAAATGNSTTERPTGFSPGSRSPGSRSKRSTTTPPTASRPRPASSPSGVSTSP